MNQKPATGADLIGSTARRPARPLASALVLLAAGALSQTQNTTTNYAYDAQGNLTTITDPNNQVTTQSFDALNRRIQLIAALGGGFDPNQPLAAVPLSNGRS